MKYPPLRRKHNVMHYNFDSFHVVSPVNEPETLRRCLAASPDIASGRVRITTVDSAPSAVAVIADALQNLEAPIIIYAHQDVYLPSGFFETLAHQLDALDERAPGWALVGAIGRDSAQNDHGEVWSTDRGKVVGKPIVGPAAVDCVDECLIVLPKRSLAYVDANVPHFHLYGVDIVQNAKEAGATSFALPMQIVHHAKPITSLAGGYATAHKYMRLKWRSRLPITTLIVPLERTPWKLWKMRVGARIRRFFPVRHGYGQSTDPRSIAQELGYE
ncbi:hypothetical protein [Microbacterium testaceum]|uniref:hypothetical protein n=1 Tax=Microbacterium testaceum TaxID=2033 RepID=UPI002AC4ABFF|nr:hypothetical protein [Microbacterium testaceum]MDZ5146128.1 hypothetical protein [Microbacterium testaceum]